MISNKNLELRLLSGIMQFPDVWSELCTIINEEDFPIDSSKVHYTIFKFIKNSLDKGEKIDEIVIAEKIKNSNISFEDDIDITEYILNLKNLNIIDKESVLAVAKELKRYSIRRQIERTGQKLQMVAKQTEGLSIDEILAKSDKVYNENINTLISNSFAPQNIFEDMEEFIEERGNNPIEEMGLPGPYKRLNDLYGSLLRPGNISALVARSAVGKTSLAMDISIKTADMTGVPVLHFDNGEMSKKELQMRECAALSGVPMHDLETGKWRRDPTKVKKVRDIWDKVKMLKFYYLPVGMMNFEEMIREIKRFYYGKIGRYDPKTHLPNQLIFSFDYLKPKHTDGYKEYEYIGEMVQNFKSVIQSDIVDDCGNPVISMLTSVQANRLGITNNKKSDEIQDDEGVVSLSDRITQQVSQLFLFRTKTLDEIQYEESIGAQDFGTHKLINLKPRFLGKMVKRAKTPIKFPDGSLKRNDIHIKIDNFNVEEKGDTVDLLERANSGRNIATDDSNEENLP